MRQAPAQPAVAPRATRTAAPLRRIVGSFRFAFAGLLAVVRTQPNSWVHLGAALIAIGLAVLLRLPPAQWAILALAIGLVLATEAVNTAIEALGDAVSPAYHPLVKRAKDAAAAAVLLAALTAVAVGLALFGPPLWSALSPR